MTGDETRGLSLLVGGLKAQIEAFQSNWAEQDRRASDGRKFMFERIEGLGTNVRDLSHQVGSVVKDVAEMKPAVTDWVNAKNQAMGAKTAASILGKSVYILVGGCVALIGYVVAHFSPAVLH